MALPSKRIKKIKLPGDVSGSQTYDIVPEMLQKNGYSAELPTLTANDNIVTTNSEQEIDGFKVFETNPNIRAIVAEDSSTGEYEDVIYFNKDSNGGRVVLPGHLVIYGDDDGNDNNKPTDETHSDDLDTTFYNTGIYLNGDSEHQISFPNKSGIFAVTSDLTEIVDLTQINQGN